MTQEKIDLVAEVLANRRGLRNGMPPITNILDLLPGDIKQQVVDDATAVLEVLENEQDKSLTSTEQAALVEFIDALGDTESTVEVWLKHTKENEALVRQLYAFRYGDRGETYTESGGMLCVHTASLLTDWLWYRLTGEVPVSIRATRHVSETTSINE